MRRIPRFERAAFNEKLATEHDIEVSYTCVKEVLHEAGGETMQAG